MASPSPPSAPPPPTTSPASTTPRAPLPPPPPFPSQHDEPPPSHDETITLESQLENLTLDHPPLDAPSPHAPPPNPLLGLTAVQHAFDYLDGPAEVLAASLASRRWRVLATADVVWRGKFEREGMEAKAGRWQVAVLGVAGNGGGGRGDGSSSAAEAAEGGRVTMAVYKQIFVLKVRSVSLVCHLPLR